MIGFQAGEEQDPTEVLRKSFWLFEREKIRGSNSGRKRQVKRLFWYPQSR